MYRKSQINRSEVYLNVLPLFTSGRARLIDNARLVTQFAGLERRTFPTGKDRVNHGRAGHDDLCNAVAGAMELASHAPVQQKMVGATWWSPRTGFVEPGRVPPNVPGGPSYRAEPPSHYLKNGQSGEPWRGDTTDAGVSTRGGRWWGPV